jgi:hypothetical protein
VIPQICSLAEVSVLSASEACDGALNCPICIRTFTTFRVQVLTFGESYAAHLCNLAEATSYLLGDHMTTYLTPDLYGNLLISQDSVSRWSMPLFYMNPRLDSNLPNSSNSSRISRNLCHSHRIYCKITESRPQPHNVL